MLALLESGLPTPARGVFTTRQGGVSAPPWASLNLGVHVGDTHAKVQANRARLTDELSGEGLVGLAFGKQVHGAGVRLVSGLSAKTSRGLDATDGMVTAVPGIGLAILGGDCLPVLLASASGRPVVGAAHVGRGGLVKGVLHAVVAVMRQHGAAEVQAVIGPGICGGCYEVPGSMAGEAELAAPGSRCATSRGTIGIDLAAGAASQLSRDGVTATTIEACTAEQPERFYSYRRDGVTGRHAGVVWLP